MPVWARQDATERIAIKAIRSSVFMSELIELTIQVCSGGPSANRKLQDGPLQFPVIRQEQSDVRMAIAPAPVTDRGRFQ